MQTTAKQNPLDVLVISQLTALRRHEAALQQEVERGNARTATDALFELRDRAERLNRMIDAMSVNGSGWYGPVSQPLAV
jgi:small-conductance mechanosensitive channel